MSRTRQNWEFNDCFWDCLFCKVFQKSKKVGGVKSGEDERIIMYVMVMLCDVMWIVCISVFGKYRNYCFWILLYYCFAEFGCDGLCVLYV